MISRQPDGESKHKGVENVRENGTNESRQDDSPQRQDRAHQQHRQQVKEAEGDIRLDQPIDSRDDDNESTGEQGARSPFEITEHLRCPPHFRYKSRLRPSAPPKDSQSFVKR